MSEAKQMVVSYLAAWNERDPGRRRALVARTFTEDGTYTDAKRAGSGHAQIDALIAATQSQLPGYQLRLASGIDAVGECVRFRWFTPGGVAGPGSAVALMGDDGRFEAVAGFEAVPARS
jgi:hypothetical protein